jgi:alpha-galactosidase/6-phospho-beta-glucosidase family protein
MKITLIGAGSFVFGGTVLIDALERLGMEGELALVDLNLEAAEAMAGVGRQMAREFGLDCAVWATADRREALPGSDFVILSAAPQGARRWWMDYRILAAAGMSEQARECGGLGGLSYSLRTVSLALDVCADMAALCPGATLLDVTNPMPRVVTAVHHFTEVPVYGFCNMAFRGAQGYEWLAGLVGLPWTQVEVVTAGLNHFAWLVSMRDRETGADFVPFVEDVIRRGEGQEMVVLRRWLQRYGAVSVTGVDHTAEFLPTEADTPTRAEPPFHGDEAERQAHMARLVAAGAGELDWRLALDHGSWEHPVEVAAALCRRETVAVPILNLPNHGYLPDLPEGRIVEVPARTAEGRLSGVEVGALPGEVGAICRAISDVHELVAQGAAMGDRDALRSAIEIDPAVDGKAAGLAVLEELIAAHRDLLPRFA